MQGRVVRVERHEAEAGEGQGQDALGLPHPAAGLALALAGPPPPRGRVARLAGTVAVLTGRPVRPYLFDRHLLGHHTSRITGSTTGLRWKRWLTKRRTALRTVAPSCSRSNTAGSRRAPSPSRTAAFTPPLRPSAPFLSTNPPQP